MHNRHVAIIFRYQRAKSSFPLETRGNFVANGKIHSKSRRRTRRDRSSREAECGSGSVRPSVARRAPDSVLAPILIHDRAASRIEAWPVVHQAVKYSVAIRNGRPADAERIAEAGLSLFCGLGDRSRTQEGDREGSRYRCKCFEWRQGSQVKLSRQPFVWHVHRSVRFCVSPDKHHRHSRRLPYDRRATVHNIRREVVMARTLIPDRPRLGRPLAALYRRS